MENICGNYTAAQLRDWLQRLGLPSTGTKSALLLRLNEVPAEKRGEFPKDDIGVLGGSVGEEDECAGSVCAEEQQENECIRLQTNEQNMILNDFEILRKELEIVQREKELLRRENELLKKIALFEKGRENKNAVENDRDKETMSVYASNDEGRLCSNSNNNKLNASFSILKDMIPDYDGGLLPELWITQFKSINNVYDVDENTVKALLMCKLKGSAQTWLHSKPNFVYETAEEILNEMKNIFCTKENKLTMRRKFEARKWKYAETFIDYYNEKIMLASKVDVSDEELIDNIIEGIPDEQLRVQASLQCYVDKTQLLQAFSKIQLKQQEQQFNRVGKDDQTKEERERKLRCYNCNSFGHFAAECKKPKRPMGSCYGCGSLEHRVAACPERKAAVQFLGHNEYVRYFKFCENSSFT